VRLTRRLDQAQRLIAEPRLIALRRERPERVKRTLVLGVVTQNAQIIGELELVGGTAALLASGPRIDCTHVGR
jgi:hypothetical protein